MNYKRGRPKNRRAGCLMCKPHKANGAKQKRPAREQAQRHRMNITGALYELHPEFRD